MSDNVTALEQRIRQHDGVALSEFLELKRPVLLGFITRSMSNGLQGKVEPADVFQDVSISALKALPSIELGDRDPFHWLCQLAERRIVDAHRRHFGAEKRSAKREVALDAPIAGQGQGGLIDLISASMTSPSGAFKRDEREQRILQALEQLPEQAREALRLRYLQGLPSKQVAEQLGKTDGAVRVLLSRSLAKLQELLADDDYFESYLGPAP